MQPEAVWRCCWSKSRPSRATRQRPHQRRAATSSHWTSSKSEKQHPVVRTVKASRLFLLVARHGVSRARHKKYLDEQCRTSGFSFRRSHLNRVGGAGASDAHLCFPISRAAGRRSGGESCGRDDRGQHRPPGGHCHVWLCRRKQPPEPLGTHDRQQPVMPTPQFPEYRTSGTLFWQQTVKHNIAAAVHACLQQAAMVIIRCLRHEDQTQAITRHCAHPLFVAMPIILVRFHRCKQSH